MRAKIGMARVILKLLPALALLAAGCGLPQQGMNQDFAKSVRPPSGDVARLKYNAHYFKVMGQPQLALKEMEEAYRSDPANPAIADLLAGYYDELGMHQEATKIYQEALSRNPNRQLQNNLCFSYYLAGNFSQAEECFRHSLSRDPQNQTARNNLGLLLCRLGRQGEARRLWEAAGTKEEAAKKLEQVMAALSKTGAGSRPEQAAARPAPAAPPAVQAQSRPDADRSRVAAPVKSAPAAKVAAPLAAAPRPPAVTPPPAVSKPVTVAQTVQDTKPVQGPVAAAPPARSPQAADLKQPLPPVLAKTQNAVNAVSKAAPTVVSTGTPEKSKEDAKAKIAGDRGTRQAPISAQELLDTRIEVQNGNGIADLAHKARSLMNLEGLDDVSIGNYIDFGVERSQIRYRRESEKIARMLHDKLFAKAELKMDPKLEEDVDIQVILGKDAPELPQIMAQKPGKPQKSL
jgi:Tfp pilus assembly protein PilF